MKRETFRQWLDRTMRETGIDELEAQRDRHVAAAEVAADQLADAGGPRLNVAAMLKAPRPPLSVYPPRLVDTARACREIYDRAAAELGPDLDGGSLLDLCADNLLDSSLSDLKAAIVISGIERVANQRIRKQMALTYLTHHEH